MVEDALVEKLTKRNEELTKELERRDAETKTNWKMSCAIDWLLGNLLFFGLLITAKGIISLIIGGSSENIPVLDLVILGTVYWILIIQGIYRAVVDFVDIFRDDMQRGGSEIMRFIEETKQARREYFARKEAEKDPNFSTMTPEQKKEFLETGKENQ